MIWLNDSLSGILIFLGIALLAVEMLVFAFSSFILFFIGLACLITGLLMFLGLLAPTLTVAFATVAILTGLLAVLLWKPLKNMQSHVDHTPASGDLVGHSFILSGDVEPGQTINYRYSGIEWRVKSDQALSVGTEVEVTVANVGEFTVTAKIK
ncbi:NfeD family protein [Haliea sp. AH-315-K21]|uniref:Activity regulator of membrane protease YbbK n=1 Tax=SAR86 cluster bacterium TaxID=2030880 RepID=A0A2A5CHY3_9GAMM|nr:NfeD family protein [Haliea sp. AH-315-K21]PCJ43392.1 MAG: activity regulator of membrane protease YbbK [SAR86 cluster bacterium]